MSGIKLLTVRFQPQSDMTNIQSERL